MIDAPEEPFRWTEAGGVELILLGAAVLLTLAVALIFAIVLLRRDPRDPSAREPSRSPPTSGSDRS